jgi:Tfp pilus assembly PilM family ATPase
VKTTNTSGVSKQELLCVGVDRLISQNINENIEGAGAEVVAITVPLYASIRAFDKLYRRDGDDKMTSMLIDMEGADSMVMIAHGANCVFAHRTELKQHEVKSEWTPETDSFPQVISMPGAPSNEFDRREENEPRGLCGVRTADSTIDTSFTGELERCLRHHNSLFPDRAVDRIIFTGTGANDAECCSAIAASVGIEGFIADPSAWIDGAAELAAGPAWTTAAGMCLRYSEVAA